VDLRAVRRRCESTLQDVAMPTPFDVHAFSQVVAERRGREVHLLPKTTSAGPCGVWLAMPDADYVFYEQSTSVLHRDHIILHELGHLLSDHDASELMDDDVLRELLPNLDLAMIRRLLGRTTYTAVEEQEAEMIATLVLQRADRRGAAPPAATSGEVTLVLARLQATLGGESPDRR